MNALIKLVSFHLTTAYSFCVCITNNDLTKKVYYAHALSTMKAKRLELFAIAISAVNLVEYRYPSTCIFSMFSHLVPGKNIG